MDSNDGSGAAAAEQGSARYGAFQRLYLSFTSPTAVFHDIGIKPTWVLCLILLVLIGVVIQLISVPHLDLEATIREGIDARGQEVSDEELEVIVETSGKFAKFAPLIGLFLGPIVMLILGALYFLGTKLVGSTANFPRIFSATLHAYWPPAVAGGVVYAILLQRLGMVTENTLKTLVKSNVGAFLSTDTPSWLRVFASSFDLFSIWTVVLLILGLSATGKISRGKSVTVVLVLWGIWIVGKTGLTAVFSQFTG